MTEHDRAILERPYAASSGLILQAVEVLNERDKTFVCKVVDSSARQMESVVKVVLDGGNSRLERESAILHRLRRSPHVVRWLDKGKETDRVWLQTEWLDGGNLARWMRKHDLKQHEEAEGRFKSGLRELLVYAADVCLGLKELHDLGLIHTDVKPENICLATKEYSGQDRAFAKLIDLGLAHEPRSFEGGLRQGEWAGTHDYAPPEALRGDWSEVDARSDIYSLGATLWKVLTSSEPFPRGLAGASQRQVGNLDPWALPLALNGLAPQLEPLLKEMLEPDAKHRVQRVEDVYERLRQIIKDLDPGTRGYVPIDVTRNASQSGHPASDMRDGQWDPRQWERDFVPLHPGSEVTVMRHVVTKRVFWALNKDHNFLKHEHGGNGAKPYIGSFRDARQIIQWLNQHEAFRGRRTFRLIKDREWSALARVSVEEGDTPRQRMLWWNGRSRTVVPSLEHNEFHGLGEGPEWCHDEDSENPAHQTVRGTPLPDWFLNQLGDRPNDDIIPASLVVAAENAHCGPEKLARLFFPQSWPKGRVRLVSVPFTDPPSSTSPPPSSSSSSYATR